MNLKSIIALGILVLASTAGFADQKDKGGPIALEGANQIAELADGELYNLYGTIMIGPSQTGPGNAAYLKVDFAKQPWLANAHRQEVPYYPIDADAELFARYDHKNVKFGCVAEGKITTLVNGTQSYVIFLKPYSAHAHNSRD